MGKNKYYNNATCKGERQGYSCDECPFWETCDSKEFEEKENDDYK